LGLTHLQAAEFLYETRLFPEIEYTFKHALTQQVAYETLLQERRRRLHARIVAAIETLAEERVAEQVDRLAHHALRGELWDKALLYCRQAGTRAAARSAHREAVMYFEQALAALTQIPERRDTLEQAIDLRLDLRNALLPLDEEALIFDYLRDAEALAERLGDNQRLVQIARFLCVAFLAMGEHDRAIAASQRALTLATPRGAFDVQVGARNALCMAYYAIGDYRQALDVAQEVMALLTGERRLVRLSSAVLPAVYARYYVAGCLTELGRFAEGSSIGQEAVRLAEAAEEPYSMAAVLMWTGLLSRRQGDIHTAIPMLERSLALAQSTNIPRLFPQIFSILGAAYALAGRAGEARPLLEQMLEYIVSGSRTLFYALVLAELSEALLLVGRVDEAQMLAGRLLELSRTQRGRGYQVHAYRLLGDVTMRRDPLDVDQAAAHYRQALALAEELGMRPLQAHCYCGLGALYAMGGQREQAEAALTTAIVMYRAMAMTFWLPQAEAARAQVEARAG
jgi:tetratricopeptide (TPR) repeat protein